MTRKNLTCKRCGLSGFSWSTNQSGRWQLFDNAQNIFHECTVREVKEVECKYCKANDLWWSKETMPDGQVKNVLMESYGIPHGCDARRDHFNAISQAKKDEYAKEKARIEAIPDQSKCGACTHGLTGNVIYNTSHLRSHCWYCGGSGKVTTAAKKRMLYEVRKRIWPNIGKQR